MCRHLAKPVVRQSVFYRAAFLYRHLLWVVVFNIVGSLPAAAQTVELILRDSMELAFASAYRSDTLALRDPHVFTLVPFVGCSDFTDTPLPTTTISLNNQISEALTTDGDSDGLLDLSPLFVFADFDPLAASVPLAMDQMVTQVNGQCPPPVPPALCGIDSAVPAAVASAEQMDGVCLAALEGTSGGYTPAIPTSTAPCWVTAATDFVVPFGDLAIPLQQARTAATLDGANTMLTNGLIRGFLSETEADQIPLPADLPLIGGQPLSTILPGGSGNCAANDDRDMLDGVSGWWFYLAFTALPVDFFIDFPTP